MFVARRARHLSVWLAVTSLTSAAQDCVTDDLVNWESPHVHPLELSADGALLLGVNTPDNRLLAFDANRDPIAPLYDVPVGLDPVSVRLRTPNEAWVVNHVSDSVSVVDLATRNVIATLRTADEPCDVVFAGAPERAFVSCSQANLIQVFDPSNLGAAPIDVPIEGEDPRALATDGTRVFVAVFESGNRTTVLGGGSIIPNGYPPNVVSNVFGPYFGINPPPNSGLFWDPPFNPSNPLPPPVGLIVRRQGSGKWFDDNGADWTKFVSGSDADKSGRPVGWELLDHDLAIVDANGLSVTYQDRLMNLCMAVGVDPSTGRVAVVGTNATNVVRFEPNLNGVFVRVRLAIVDPDGVQAPTTVDLNPHLDYSTSSVSKSKREKSIGDPRGVVWNAAGSKAYLTGMGSNNVVVVDSTGSRAGIAPTIEVGEGPTGVALDEPSGRLFVLNKFAASVSVVDTVTEAEVYAVPFFDPSPAAIKRGRRHLYGTHETSGLGHVSCASCHADARMDRLSWDLGDPSGEMKDFDGNCLDGLCQDWHPAKGPMVTQTLVDIIGKEPHHWRADREGIEAFNPAFESLLGADGPLAAAEMQEFEDFLATLHFPPNPFRNLDNSLPTSLPLPGHYTPGRFAPAGQPLPNGNAQRGLELFRPPHLLDIVACVTCHTLPTGLGTDYDLKDLVFEPIPPGPNGERHHGLVSIDGSTNITMKVPQLRNLYDRVGFDATQPTSVAGFGFLHDGSVDSLARFITEPLFDVGNDQEVADLVAFMLAFSGSDLPEGDVTDPLEPPGSPSRDAHAAVGVQTTLVDLALAQAAELDLIDALVSLADDAQIGLVVKGRQSGEARGWAYTIGGLFQSDRLFETATLAQLQAAAAVGSELTFTAVPFGSETRIGIDRDADQHFDADERDAGSDPADCASFPRFGDKLCDPALVNSTGSPGVLEGEGSVLVAANDVTLRARQLPPGEFAVVLAGRGRGGAAVLSGGRVGLCIGTPFGAFAATAGTTDGNGEIVLRLDLAGVPSGSPSAPIQPGETWVFQVGYQDGGATLYTDALRVRFR